MAELEGLGFMVVPFWEELVHTPAFFGKSAEEIESKELG